MTRRRRILLSAGFIAAYIVATIGMLATLPPRPGVTKANFDRIEEGMTLAEVNEILGGPPTYLIQTNEGLRIGGGWPGPDWAIAYVDVSDDKPVSEKQWVPSTETIGDRILRWLHLRKATPPPKFQ